MNPWVKLVSGITQAMPTMSVSSQDFLLDLNKLLG